MLQRRLTTLLQKRQTAAGYMASAGKVGSEEKWAHAAMEYIYEKKHVNDGNKKRQHDVQLERRVAAAFDRYAAHGEAVFEARLARLNARMTEALEAVRALDRRAAALEAERRATAAAADDAAPASTLIEECVLLHTEQPPGSFQRPALAPPLAGYEPGYALDVPQLRSQQAEYPAVHRPTDDLQFRGGGGGATDDGGFAAAAEPDSYHQFPYVETYALEDLTAQYEKKLDGLHGALRLHMPLTGVEGEGWEAYVALQRKALRRQRLLIDLAQQGDFAERFERNEDGFRDAELARRGLLPLRVEGEEDGADAAAPTTRHKRKDGRKKAAYNNFEEHYHFAQVPAYEPFRVM
ncbi:hypothetical protein STCU_05015 [Strigomonas culicis]|uniref:Uncharacterized protein n=1 Tax=Strigomonas culicis TaxID=28005 RepID=S9VY36_9TRYP|nr:hypothetical protein STCU_05015 [Strigomonas culicis]|eukprot:EPY28565.1 hypothetical protein STCU_05015 [Strigomonas culicis]